MKKLILAAATLLATSLSAASADELFKEPNRYVELREGRSRIAKRSRAMRADLAIIEAAVANRPLKLNLFSDVELDAVIDSIETNRTGAKIFKGKVAGQRNSHVILSVVDGAMSGTIYTESARFDIRAAGNGDVEVVELDMEGFPGDSEPIRVDPPAARAFTSTATATVAAAADSGATIDILVVYTAAAVTAEGSSAALVSRINTTVAETNTAFANSQINPRVRLVGTAQVSYDENMAPDSGSDFWRSALYRLQRTSDGLMDEVHALRNQYGADAVSLIVNAPAGSGTAGIGYVFTSPISTWFAPYAFNVVGRQYMTGNYTFAHELGHNMGAEHDRETSPSSQGAFAYSYGYRKYGTGVTSPFRDIMAYSCPSSCPRIPNFSNPNILYVGQPTGIPAGQSNAADNALTFNNTASSFANFRQSVTPASTSRGDFNGDGKVDLVWRNYLTGAVNVWFMNGTTYLSGANLFTVADANWRIDGVGDFNNDTKSDLVWRNYSTGAVNVWYMNGTTYLGGATLFSVADANWKIDAVADMNSDSKDDLIWRNYATGDVNVWYMNGSTYVSGASLFNVADANWKIVGAADMNGDNRNDLIWRNYSTGAVNVWFMNGSTYLSGTNILSVVDVNWRIQAVADYNGDGKNDLVWRNYATGDVNLWMMNNTTYLTGANLFNVTPVGWEIAGPR